MIIEELRCYKVVWVNGERLCSAASARIVEYIVGTFSEPFSGDGPLAAFATLRDAEDFVAQRQCWATDRTYLRIYSAVAVIDAHVMKENPNRALWIRSRGDDGELLIELSSNGLPRGTLLCSKIKLVRLVS